MISEDIVQSYIQKISLIKQGQFDDYMSHTRDVFDSRLMTYTSKNQQWLFGAVIGEIGANTFDHNFSFRTDVPKGVYCDFDSGDGFVYICDFGAGLKKTLSRVVLDIKDDEQAIKTAFTQPISGRAPEMRGNGLKFVISSIVENKWNLYFQSGDAFCKVDGSGYEFGKASFIHDGCFCILSCKGE